MSPVPAEVRAAILARMVMKAPERKLGRTQVMKLFYFLQELKGVPLGYDFRLFTYGPFDSDVLGDISAANRGGTVEETAVFYSRGYGYDIKPGPRAADADRDFERRYGDLVPLVDDTVGKFGGFGAAELELRSTIFFVYREGVQNGSPFSPNVVASRVGEIKPHFDSATILNRIGEMRADGILSS